MTPTKRIPKEVSVVIGSFNRLNFLKLTVESVRKELSNFAIEGEMIIVDGGSADGSIEWLIEQKDIIAIIQHNRGTWQGKPLIQRSWGYFMNLAFKVSQGKFIAMLSDDCLVVPGALYNGIKCFNAALSKNPKTATVAFYWRNWPENKDYFVSLAVGKYISVNHGLYLTEALKDVDFIDEDAFLFYHADSDLCLRLVRAGWTCIDCKESFIEHYSHANVETKKSNFEHEITDYRTYLERWAHLNPPQDPNFSGYQSWLSFDDPDKTAELFNIAINNEATLDAIVSENTAKAKTGGYSIVYGQISSVQDICSACAKYVYRLLGR